MERRRPGQRAAARWERARIMAFRNSSSPARAGSTGLGYVTCAGGSGDASTLDGATSIAGLSTETANAAALSTNGEAETTVSDEAGGLSLAPSDGGNFSVASGAAMAIVGSAFG